MKFVLNIWSVWLVTLLPFAHVAAAKPVFVGTSNTSPACYERKSLLSLTYMTSDQMAEKVRFLTGFYQPGFEEYGAIIGIYDARTGVRTSDRPTVMSVMIVEKLVGDVAQSVLAREEFLDQSDRIVYRDIDLARSPNDAALSDFIFKLCSDWLSQSCPVDIESELLLDFRRIESGGEGLGRAWTHLVDSLLQNGSIYYY